jgi:GNAT superfamily N-acetyltransferase
METTLIYELIGYAASVLVAISLMMSNIIQLRIVNMIGAATFSLYGILIGSIPVAAMNGFIVLINVYYLTQIYSAVEYFRILRIPSDSDYLMAFLKFYQDQINEFQPGFNYGSRDDDVNLFVLRDMVPAGVLIGNIENHNTLRVELDFVVPQYRDFEVGTFLFEENRSYFKDLGVNKIVAAPGTQKHNEYLEEMGFSRDKEGNGDYQLRLGDAEMVTST